MDAYTAPATAQDRSFVIEQCLPLGISILIHFIYPHLLVPACHGEVVCDRAESDGGYAVLWRAGDCDVFG